MRKTICLALLFMTMTAQAQYKCTISGRAVVQDEPCATERAVSGKYRCWVDGEVVYSGAPCATIKSKEQLANETKAAATVETQKRIAEAKRLEAADQKNSARRILYAQQETARHLLDPDSARFGASYVSWYSGSAVVCGVVSGRNGFGGYAQPVRFVTWDDWVTIDDGKVITAFDEHWGKYCGPLPR